MASKALLFQRKFMIYLIYIGFFIINVPGTLVSVKTEGILE